MQESRQNCQTTNRNDSVVTIVISLLGTVALFGFAGAGALGSQWGVNHLRYLSPRYWYLFGIIALVIVLTLIGSTMFHRFSTFSGRRRLPINIKFGKWRLLLSLTAGVVFFILRIDTFLLGDGYAWLSILGNGPNYIHKFTEPGSIVVIRMLQALSGGYTSDTALFAFQVVSFVSGIVVSYNFLSMALVITQRGTLRALFLVTTLSSGATLLFMGYVEFYPILWAAVTTFIYQALR